MTEEKRFYTDCCINGYYNIIDSNQEGETIWVDCSLDQLKLFIDALNKGVSYD